MKEIDFAMLAKLVRDRSGLILTRDKEYLLDARLLPVVRKHGLSSLEALCAMLRQKAVASIERDIVEAMTTNESFFFRDTTPFKLFREMVLPELLAARQSSKQLRIWCAACSSGQEPYSLAMILEEERARLAGWRVEIVGTDLSAEMVERSKAGSYSHFEVQRGLPVQYLTKYFRKSGDRWEILPELRAKVSFRTFNLLDDFAALGRFDVIFCRNVLIYFDAPTKGRVLGRMSSQLAPDGALFLGGAETVLGITDRFVPHPTQRGIYVQPQSLKAAG